MTNIFSFANAPEEQDILRAIRKSDLAAIRRTQALRKAGIHTAFSSGMRQARSIMESAKLGAARINAHVDFTLADRGVIEVAFRKGSLQQKIGVPIISGHQVQYLGKQMESELGLSMKQPSFVTHGYLLLDRPKGKRAVTLGEIVSEQFHTDMLKLQYDAPAAGLTKARKNAFSVFKTAIFASSETYTHANPPPQADALSGVLHAAKFQVMISEGKAPVEWEPAISRFGGNPFSGNTIDLSEATAGLQQGMAEYSKHGIFDRFNYFALKPEAGMEGFVTGVNLGQLTPYGSSADIHRQAYQTWALRPLIGDSKGKGWRPLVSTEAVEGAAKAIGDSPFRIPANVLMTADPKVEQAFGLSAGGGVFTEDFLKRLAYKTSTGEVRVPGVGSQIMAGRQKVSVAAIVKEISGGLEGVLSLDTMTKYGDEIKSQMVSTVLRGLNKHREVPHGAKLRFLEQIAQVVGAKPVVTDAGEYALNLRSDIQLGDSELGKIKDLVSAYNKTGGIGEPIPADIQWTSADVVTSRGQFQTKGVIASMGIGVREGQDISGPDAISWTAKRPYKGQRLRVLGDRGHRIGVHASTTRRGIKLSMRDVFNLKLHGNKEADAIANVMLQAMAGYRQAEKKDIWSFFAPIMGTQRVPGGIKIDSADIAKIRPLGAPSLHIGDKAYYTAADLAGTITDPFDVTGKTIDLNEPFRISSKLAGTQSDVGATQLHFLGGKTLGLGRSKVVNAAGASVEVYHLNALARSQAKAFEAVQAGAPDEQVTRWLERTGSALVGKSDSGGLLSKYSEPRLAHSAYLKATPGGTGEVARLLGTELKPVTLPSGVVVQPEQIMQLSRADVMSMGPRAMREFGIESTGARYSGLYRKGARGRTRNTPVGTAWMIKKRDPSQGLATYDAVLGVIDNQAEGSVLGRGAVRLHSTLAAVGRGDFDGDYQSLLLLTGKHGQRMIERHAMKNTAPTLAVAAAFVQTQLTEQQQLLKNSGQPLPQSVYTELLDRSKAALTYEKAMADAAAANTIDSFFGTKALTGLVDYQMQAHRNLLALQPESKGKQVVAAVYDEISQQAAISKNKSAALNNAARTLFGFDASAARLKDATMRQQLEAEVGSIFHQIWNELKAVDARKTPNTQGTLPEVLARLSAEEQTNAIKLASGVFVDIHGQYTAGRAEIHSGLHAMVTGNKGALADMYKGVNAFESAKAAGADDAVYHLNRVAAEVTGYNAATAGFIQEVTHKPIPLQEAAIQQLKREGDLGAKLPTPLVDRILDWFKNPETPALHKAGVIAGSVLLGGAIVKNMMFPGYYPGEEVDPVHVAIPVPLRMPAFEMPTESIFDDVPTGRTPVDSQFSMPLQYGNMGFRARPPAVQMGAGTMEPGIMPFLTGTPNKGSVPAPMVLNHAAYQNQATNPVPQTVRVGAPRESMAASYLPSRGAAEVDSKFDMRAFSREMSGASIRFEGYNDRTDREMLGMLEAQEGSNFT